MEIAKLQAGVCVSIGSAPSNYTLGQNEVELASHDISYIGRTWDGASWSAASTPPQVLTKTAFQDYAVSQLGASTTGMVRFQAIMDACEAGTGAVKFCFSRYTGALTFEKSKVSDFTQIMVGASIMTSDERTAILSNWPTE